MKKARRGEPSRKAMTLLLLAGFIAMLSIGCSGDVKKQAIQMKKLMPRGMVDVGEVDMDSLRLKFYLPTRVYGNVHRTETSLQWVANNEQGQFRMLIAQFDDSAGTKDPDTYVKKRTKQLLDEPSTPVDVPSEHLLAMKAKEGKEVIFVLEEKLPNGVVTASRTYLIEALKYDDRIVVISLDALDTIAQDAKQTLKNIRNSFEYYAGVDVEGLGSGGKQEGEGHEE